VSSFVATEPATGSTGGAVVLRSSGLDVLRASVERRLPDPPLTHLTGLRLSEVGPGMATSFMPASEWWQSAAGVFFAGTTAFVADLALGASVLISAPAGVGVTTSELSVSYLRAATLRSQAIVGRARLIHGTRSLGLAEATLEDGRGRVRGHASSRCVLFPVDPEILAARRFPAAHRTDAADPYLREVEGEVHGPEFWDATPGLAAMEQFVQGALVPPCFRLFGLRGIEAREGGMTVAMPASEWFSNAFGVLYGGAIALLADATITMTAATTVPAATAFNTIDLKLYFLRPTVPTDGELVRAAR
jgi:uncharacterized protein (TIGR00369 family)